MAQPLRVLHLEDNRNYSALVKSKLTAEGFDPDVLCVETEAEFKAALESGPYDLIITDYNLPTYDGIKALKVAREKQPTTPILLISGTIGEEAAVESLKAGATDYVLKQRPERLIPAVRRALREADERKHRVAAETALTRREKHFQALSENSLDVVTILDQQALFKYNSLAVTRVLGYTPEELIGQNAFSFIHEADLAKVMEDFQRTLANPEQTTISQFCVRHKDGGWRYLETMCKSFVADPEIGGLVVNSRDVTERHRIEHYTEVLSSLGSKLSSAISAEAAARVIVEVADDLFGWDACTLNLYSPDEDKIFPVLSVDTIRGQRSDIPRAEIDRNPTTRTRRVLNQGSELVLREEPLAFDESGAAFGDKARPSASLMLVPIRNGTRVIGILSIQTYKLKAYETRDLT